MACGRFNLTVKVHVSPACKMAVGSYHDNFRLLGNFSVASVTVNSKLARWVFWSGKLEIFPVMTSGTPSNSGDNRSFN